MSPEQTKLVQQTWAVVAPHADAAARLFYDRLFDIDPGARRLFNAAELTVQRDKLVRALSLVVDGLYDLEALTPTLLRLGANHVRYGVEDHHYDSVGEALLWALQQALRAAWTEEAGLAWGEAYGLLAAVMREATDAEPADSA